MAHFRIKPYALEKTTCMLGEQSKNKLETIQLSSNTVKSRTQDLLADIEICVVSRLKSSFVIFVGTSRINRRVIASSSTCMCMLLVPEQNTGRYTV